MLKSENYKILLAFIVFFTIVFFLAHSYVRNSQAEITLTLETQLAQSISELENTAQLVYKNKVNESVGQIVRDCKRKTRSRFDNYLNQLNTLNQEQLGEAELLLMACGSFFADQKLAMVEELKNDFSSYQQITALYKVVNKTGDHVASEADWLLFINLQEQQAQLLKNQVPLQADVISLLKAGESPSSEEVRAKMSEATEISESASVLIRQIDSVYARLVKDS